MINRQEPGPSPLEQQAGSSAGNKAEILSPDIAGAIMKPAHGRQDGGSLINNSISSPPHRAR